MRVAPIQNIFQQRAEFKNNLKDYSCYRVPVTNDSFVPSFNSKNLIYVPIKTARDFKLHAIKQQLPCIYCGRPMTYTDSMYEEWKRNKIFSGSVKTFIKTLKPYKISLHDTPKAIFSFFEQIAKRNPEARIDNIIKLLSLEANKKLLKAQAPIFNELIQESRNLPPEHQYKLFELIQRSKFRMLKKPHLEEFSGKEFSYKMKNLANTVPDEKLSLKIKKLSELLTLPGIKYNHIPLDEKTINRVLKTLSPMSQKQITVTSANEQRVRDSLRYRIIKKIKQEAEPLNRKDITELCIDGQKRLQGIPVVCKFANKSFIYDLSELLESVEGNKQVKAKLFQIASRLPTSEDNISAFITKHDSSSPEKIAYDMLIPSVVTIEHMWPKFHKGPNIIANMAIACKKCNNSRQDKDMKQFLKSFHPLNQKRYWQEIAYQVKNGFIEVSDAQEMMTIFNRQSGRKYKL